VVTTNECPKAAARCSGVHPSPAVNILVNILVVNILVTRVSEGCCEMQRRASVACSKYSSKDTST
jgi:hypothetical protein